MTRPPESTARRYGKVFDEIAAEYDRHRPTYPGELVDQGFVKVVGGVQPGERHVRSSSWRARRGSWAQRRVSSVYLVTPCIRKRVMTRLARADQTWGAF